MYIAFEFIFTVFLLIMKIHIENIDQTVCMI